MPGKLPDPSVCPTCKAAYHNGRWTWDAAPADAHRQECPACRRVADDYPAGIVTMRGSFLAPHGEEIRNLLHNVETREKQNHPLKRIMAISADADRSWSSRRPMRGSRAGSVRRCITPIRASSTTISTRSRTSPARLLEP